jgi:hypothetical protein
LLRRHLVSYRTEQGPDWSLFSADCGIEKVLPGGKAVHGKKRLYWGAMLSYYGHSLDEMAGRLISMVRDLVADRSKQFIRLRAGAVSQGGIGLLLPSPRPESRLATLVGMLLRTGADHLGDEVALIDPVHRQLHPLALPVLIPREGVVHFPELDGGPPRRARAGRSIRDEAWRRPLSVAALGSREAGPVSVGRIVFPQFDAGARPELVPIPSSEATFLLTQSVLNLDVWRERALIVLTDLLRGAESLRLAAGSPQEAFELLTARVPGAAG